MVFIWFDVIVLKYRCIQRVVVVRLRIKAQMHRRVKNHLRAAGGVQGDSADDSE